MSHSAVLARTPAYADRDWMLDRTVSHKIVARLTSAHPALPDLLDRLARAGGTLHALDVRPAGGGLEVVLRAQGLAPDGARRLADGFALLPEVASASVEHMLIR